MGIYYEYDSMAPKKRQKFTKSTKKKDKTKRVGLGVWWVGGWQIEGLDVGM